MKSSTLTTVLSTSIVAMVMCHGGMAFAADKKPAEKAAPKAWTTEQREEMAKAHEAMAVCLRSTKSIEDCHHEMMKTCEEKMGEHSCPMMGEMHGMHDMQGMQGMHESKSPAKKTK